MIEISESEHMQSIASKLDSDTIQAMSDHSYTFDTDDCYNCAGIHKDGIQWGLDLGLKVANNPEYEVWLVRFNDYADDDGLAFFVGTENEIVSRLETAMTITLGCEDKE